MTAAISLPTGYALSLLTNDRKQRGDAWTSWNEVNRTLRVQDGAAPALQHALGQAEWALRYGHVPHELYLALEVSAWGYWNFWRVFPHGNPAPNAVRAVHQRTVDELRLILQHPIKDRFRRRPDYRVHLALVESVFAKFQEMHTELAAIAADRSSAAWAIDATTGRLTPEAAAEFMRLSSEDAEEAAEANDEPAPGI
jgi:hypothetical protein